MGRGVLSESVGDLPMCMCMMMCRMSCSICFLVSVLCESNYKYTVFFQSTHGKIRGKAGSLTRRSLDPNSKKASSIFLLGSL